MNCPLCLHSSCTLFDQDKVRSYYKCGNCQLVFVPRDALISLDEEKKRYDNHDNSSEDPGYKDYLNCIAESILPHVKGMKDVLDFGSGRTIMLESILETKGFNVESYDIFYHPDETVWDKQYDFIILSEVIEHLNHPREVMLRLRSLLRPNGKIFVKTKPYPDDPKKFNTWFYKRDITHIQFFNQNVFEVMAEILQFRIPVIIGEDLFLFKE